MRAGRRAPYAIEGSSDLLIIELAYVADDRRLCLSVDVLGDDLPSVHLKHFTYTASS